MHLSLEALYQWIYNDAKDGGTWHEHLWRRRHKSRPHLRYRHLRFGLPEHEGLATHTDRKSRLLTLIRLGNVARIKKSMAYCGVTSPRERVVRYRIGH